MKKYKYNKNIWWFYVGEGEGDGGLLKDNHWYQVINKDIIEELNINMYRKQKLKRILNG